MVLFIWGPKNCVKNHLLNLIKESLQSARQDPFDQHVSIAIYHFARTQQLVGKNCYYRLLTGCWNDCGEWTIAWLNVFSTNQHKNSFTLQAEKKYSLHTNNIESDAWESGLKRWPRIVSGLHRMKIDKNRLEFAKNGLK